MSIRKKVRKSYRYQCGNLYTTVIKIPVLKSKRAKRGSVMVTAMIKKFSKFINESESSK